MIRTKRFRTYDKFPQISEKTAMSQLNVFIKENKIKRSNILEFRTEDNANEMYFEVVISWWK